MPFLYENFHFLAQFEITIQKLPEKLAIIARNFDFHAEKMLNFVKIWTWVNLSPGGPIWQTRLYVGSSCNDVAQRSTFDRDSKLRHILTAEIKFFQASFISKDNFLGSMVLNFARFSFLLFLSMMMGNWKVPTLWVSLFMKVNWLDKVGIIPLLCNQVRFRGDQGPRPAIFSSF